MPSQWISQSVSVFFLLNSTPWLFSVCSAWDQQGRWKIILTGQLTILHKYYKQEWQLHMDFHPPVRRRDVRCGSIRLDWCSVKLTVSSKWPSTLLSGQRGTSRAWPAPQDKSGVNPEHSGFALLYSEYSGKHLTLTSAGLTLGYIFVFKVWSDTYEVIGEEEIEYFSKQNESQHLQNKRFWAFHYAIQGILPHFSVLRVVFL